MVRIQKAAILIAWAVTCIAGGAWAHANGTITSDRSCVVVRAHCNLLMDLTGEISSSMVQQFDDLMARAAKSSTSPVRPIIYVNSNGGDVRAALILGRKLRQSEAIAKTGFGDVCYSACVFLLAGAVDRGIGIGGKIGLHRPYFVDSASSSLSVADTRYKKMMTEVQIYLREMNMPERLFQIMESTPPDEIKILSNQEKKDLWFGSKDPAYAEAEIAWDASVYGLSSLEFVNTHPSCHRLGCLTP